MCAKKNIVPASLVLLYAAFVVTSQPLRRVAIHSPTVIRELPHDTRSFTQGLVYHNHLLYESTGAPGAEHSTLQKIDSRSGEVLERIEVEGIFAEGLALVDTTLIQLSWKSGTALGYHYATFAPLRSWSYRGQGWGLAAGPTDLFMSNGTAQITLRDPYSFAPLSHIEVTLNGTPLKHLNELEYAAGMVLANIWYRDSIAVIDPHSGVVDALIDCSELSRQARRRYPRSDVLNGIAYDPHTGHLYITGKYWPVLFEIAVTLP
jgi:glutaminyl-peptide cyclotransferase